MSEKQLLQDQTEQHQTATQFASSGTAQALLDSQQQTHPQQATFWPGTQQQPVVIQVININQPIVYEHYDSKKSRALGITILVCGVAAVVLNILGITFNSIADSRFNYYYWDESVAYIIGTGLWCNVVCLLSGAFAIQAAKKKTKSWIVTHMVLAIVGSVLAAIMLAHAAWAVSEDIARINRFMNPDSYSYRHSSSREDKVQEQQSWAKGVPYISVMFLLASVVEFIACIWSSSLCCKVLCCSRSANQDEQPYYMNMYGQANPGFVPAPQYGAQTGQIQGPGLTDVNMVPMVIPPGGQVAYPTQQADTSQPMPGTPPPAYS